MPLGGKGPVLVTVLWSENFLSAILIGLRFYTRTFIITRIGWDDYALIATWLLMVGYAAMSSVSAAAGLGQHAGDLTTEMFANALFFEMIAQVFACFAIGMAKVAVSLFLMRIVVNKWHKGILWFCIATMMTLSTLLAIGVFVHCTPTRSLWDPQLAAEQVCHLNFILLAKLDCGWAAAMDFFLALLPWLILWNVNMKRRDKITVCISLSLGVFAGVCGVIRTSGLDALSQTSDYLYATTESLIWTSTEVTMTIVCVCISALRPLWTHLRGGSSSGGYQEHTGPRSKRGTSYGLQNLPSETRCTYTREVSHDRGMDDADTESSKGIVTHGAAIHRVQQFNVTYEDAQSNSSTRDDVEAQPTTQTAI
ncbi:hypothetical protein G7Y89_g15841 [Cudoniella acicularis]|uniref:Rhodopsin domain-containing protein n=1 Tax=Cudoniella acicularis TaxID=354080 RepID=A0A8H4VIY1_9HELO|nr:hypothetical protein G7Y89_g15841 [Cudoniella acicularis]